VTETKTAIADALEAGDLEAVNVHGWDKLAYAPANPIVPQKAGGQALLSPFDPLVWNRPRAERLFNFHYRIELYTPEHKRKFGYYVLPFLHGETLAARVCLKSERESGVLRVNTAHLEKGAEPNAVAAGLAAELQLMSQWLGLGVVAAPRKGNLAKALAMALKSENGIAR
jgi:uncharacterized protein YcaQ